MAEDLPEGWENYKELITTLQKMNITPKADSPQDLENWIQQFAEERKSDVKTEPPCPKSSSSHIQPPRLNNFSGSKDKKGGETSYELWRYEIQGLMKDRIHTEEVIVQAIRRSVRGEAGLLAMRLGPEASLTEILMKMESVFGNVDEVETIMSDFYNARQTADEDVSSWSCRLEGILDRAVHAHKVSRPQADRMLHDMLWKGLKPALKDVSHYEKERFATFDNLRTALRRIEKEHQLDQPAKMKPTIKQAVVTETESELTGILKQINTRLEKLETQQNNEQQCQQQQHQNPHQQPYQYPRFSRYSFRGRGQPRGDRYRGRGYGRGFTRGYGQQQQQQLTSDFKFPENITCNRCRREGHIAKGCRTNTDVDGKPLN